MHHPLFPLSFLKNLASSFYFFLVFALTFIGSWGFETIFPFCLKIVSNFCGLFWMSELRDQYFHLSGSGHALDKDYCKDGTSLWATLFVARPCAWSNDVFFHHVSLLIQSCNEICKLDAMEHKYSVYSIWPQQYVPQLKNLQPTNCQCVLADATAKERKEIESLCKQVLLLHPKFVFYLLFTPWSKVSNGNLSWLHEFNRCNKNFDATNVILNFADLKQLWKVSKVSKVSKNKWTIKWSKIW